MKLRHLMGLNAGMIAPMGSRSLSTVRSAVHDYVIPRFQHRKQELPDIGEENLAVHGAIRHHWRDDPVTSQTCDEGCDIPMSMGHLADQPLAANAPARSRTIFVLTPVPSRKMRCSGFRVRRLSRHTGRTSFTSGLSCSEACAVSLKVTLWRAKKRLGQESLLGN